MISKVGHPGGTAAPALDVVEVASYRQRDQFVRLPWTIYRDDPQWVPPLILERKAFINPQKHPFYKHGYAAQFLAIENGRPVGRIMASDDPLFNAEHGSNVGCFGLFECIDDDFTAHQLLDTAADWLRNRGRTQIIGPIDYSTNYECGLLVDGFDTPQRVMMNHNPAYYQQLLTSWGLQKTKDLLAWWFRPNQQLESWRPRVERLAARNGVVIRPFRRDQMSAELERCKHLYNGSWKQNWGFVPMTDAELEDMARMLWHLAVPELMLVAEVAGEAVGFSFTLPDFNEAIRPLNGRLTKFGLPIGLIKLRSNLRRIKTGRLLALGVLEEHRRRGIAEMLILRSADYGFGQLGYSGAELSWTLEDNHMINRTIEAVGGERYKKYRVFEKRIG